MLQYLDNICVVSEFDSTVGTAFGFHGQTTQDTDREERDGAKYSQARVIFLEKSYSAAWTSSNNNDFRWNNRNALGCVCGSIIWHKSLWLLE